jgi:predicted metal-dependent enzyme (double-stranded beta helix superfamily)
MTARTLLPTPTPTPQAILDRLAAHRHQFLERAQFDEEHRWHHRLAAEDLGTDAVEVWLLTWLPGQNSPLHDHGGSSGAFTVLSGALEETVVQPGSTERDHLWTRGAIRSFGTRHIQEVRNDRSVPAVSLHAYAPALLSMTRYRTDGLSVTPQQVEVAGRDW